MTTQITPAFLRNLRPEIEAALEVLGEKHGVTFKVGNGKYGTGNFEFKLEGVAEGGITKEGEMFLACCTFWNMKREDLGATFVSAGKTYKIVGAKGRSDKIIVEREGGGLFLMPHMTVAGLLAKQRVAA